jgi:hypothetical protein
MEHRLFFVDWAAERRCRAPPTSPSHSDRGIGAGDRLDAEGIEQHMPNIARRRAGLEPHPVHVLRRQGEQ